MAKIPKNHFLSHFFAILQGIPGGLWIFWYIVLCPLFFPKNLLFCLKSSSFRPRKLFFFRIRTCPSAPFVTLFWLKNTSRNFAFFRILPVFAYSFVVRYGNKRIQKFDFSEAVNWVFFVIDQVRKTKNFRFFINQLTVDLLLEKYSIYSENSHFPFNFSHWKCNLMGANEHFKNRPGPFFRLSPPVLSLFSKDNLLEKKVPRIRKYHGKQIIVSRRTTLFFLIRVTIFR